MNMASLYGSIPLPAVRRLPDGRTYWMKRKYYGSEPTIPKKNHGLENLNGGMYVIIFMMQTKSFSLTELDQNTGIASASDETLMLKYKKGDTQALETLVERHQNQLFHFIYGYVHNDAIAQDVFQETLVRVVKSAPSYHVKAKFTTWIYRIARNLCIDHLRKVIRHKEVGMDNSVSRDEQGHSYGDFMSSDDDGPDENVLAVQRRGLLRRAIDKLKPEYREVVLLRSDLELPFEEVAKVTGVRVSTAKSRMRYALANLRRHLVRMGIKDSGGL